MNPHGDMTTPVTRGELREELATFRTEIRTELSELRTELRTELQEFRHEIKAEMKAELKEELKRFMSRDELAHMLETWAGAMTAEFRRSFKAAEESFRRDFGILDEKYRDLPPRVTRLENKVSPPRSRRRVKG